jgi:segregation and condensation protein A
MGSPLLEGGGPTRPAVVLPVFEGPLDLLLHLVRENKVSIWEIPIARVCDQYHQALRQMEELDLEIAGEYLVYAAWLLLIKSRLLLPRHEDEERDPRQELVERLIEYEKVKKAAVELGGLAELRRGVEAVRLASPEPPTELELDLAEIDVVALGRALHDVLERHQREHPPGIQLEPIRFTVREKIIELFGLIEQQRSFPLLSHVLTRPDRLESVTLMLAALELLRLGLARAHQRRAFAEIYLTSTGKPLTLDGVADA